MDFTAYVRLCFFQFIESINWVDSDSFFQKISHFRKPCQPFGLVESHQSIHKLRRQWHFCRLPETGSLNNQPFRLLMLCYSINHWILLKKAFVFFIRQLIFYAAFVSEVSKKNILLFIIFVSQPRLHKKNRTFFSGSVAIIGLKLRLNLRTMA